MKRAGASDITLILVYRTPPAIGRFRKTASGGSPHRRPEELIRIETGVARDTQGQPPEGTRPMRHLHDDDLVLYHYGEIRTAPAEVHLSICRGCRERLQTLSLDIERLSLAPLQPALATLSAARNPLRPRLAVWRRLLLLLAYAGTDRRG